MRMPFDSLGISQAVQKKEEDKKKNLNKTFGIRYRPNGSTSERSANSIYRENKM